MNSLIERQIGDIEATIDAKTAQRKSLLERAEN